DIEKIIDEIKKGKKVNKMSNEKTDDERFTAEEKKVQEFMAKPENKGVSYRDAVLEVLDSTEPKKKREFTADEIKKQEQLKVIENYLDANPRATYTSAYKILYKGEQPPSLEEKLIDEYMEKHPESDYKTAVVESLSILKKEEKEE
ncbi:unnamed protein product, partial [marine sediment metagenome]